MDRKPQLQKGKRCLRTYCSPVRLGSVCSSDMSPTSALWQPMRSEEQGAREKKEGGSGAGWAQRRRRWHTNRSQRPGLDESNNRGVGEKGRVSQAGAERFKFRGS